MRSALDWRSDGLDWPHHDASRFVEAGGVRWHLQQMGKGPTLLLLHGTGASTHSWRHLVPLLSPHFSLVVPDLPGHAFSSRPPADGMSLPGMARALSALLVALDARPMLAVGHSAGAAIALRMSLDGLLSPAAIVSINGALVPFGGLAGRVFAPVARVLAAQAWVPHVFARRAARPEVLERLIEATGSTLDAHGLALYGRLVRSPGHAAGALAMMANWDLDTLQRDLPRLQQPLHLLVGGNDRTVAPRQAEQTRALLPGTTLRVFPGLGHLAHEEQPALLADAILAFADHAARPG